MPPSSIGRIRRLIRTLSYVVSLHAVEEMEDDGITILDLESIILTGIIVERQKDREPMKRKSSSAAAHSTAAKPRPSSKSADRVSSTSLPSISSKRLCASCGHTGPQLRKVTRSFGSGKTLLVIEGIPMWSCPRCGESYFSAETMHELERIKTLRQSLAAKRSVSVAAFAREGA